MPTQIASTPVSTGKAAEKILNQIKTKPSKEAQQGIKILFDMFKDKER